MKKIVYKSFVPDFIAERDYDTSVFRKYLEESVKEGMIDFDNMDFPILDMVTRLHLSGLILRNPDYLGNRVNYDFVVETFNSFEKSIRGSQSQKWELGHVQDRTFEISHLERFITQMIIETIPETQRSNDLAFILPDLSSANPDLVILLREIFVED